MRSEIRQAAETALLELGIDDDMLGKVTVTNPKWGEQVKFHDIELSPEDIYAARKVFDALYEYNEVSVKMTEKFDIRSNGTSGVVFKVINN